MGPSLAFKVIEGYSYSRYHALGIVVGIIAMVILYFVQEPQGVRNLDAGRKALPSNNMLRLFKDRNLLPIYQSIFFISLFFGLIMTFTAIFIEQFVPDTNPGIFFTLFGVGCLVSNLIVGPISDHRGRAVVAFPCMLITGAGLATFYFLPVNHWIMYIGSIIIGFGHAGCMTVLITWIIDRAPLERRTTALALQDSTEDIGIALGALLSGIIIPIIGMPWLYGISGGLLILFAIWKVIVSLRKKT
jgi:predicted MFS family arabinose efflux permease